MADESPQRFSVRDRRSGWARPSEGGAAVTAQWTRVEGLPEPAPFVGEARDWDRAPVSSPVAEPVDEGFPVRARAAPPVPTGTVFAVTPTLLRRTAIVAVVVYALILLDVSFGGLLTIVDGAFMAAIGVLPAGLLAWLGALFSLLGTTVVLVIVAAAAGAIAALRLSRIEGGLVVASSLGLAITVAITKLMLARARPVAPDALAAVPGFLVPTGFAFPSGHAAIALLVWGLAILVLRGFPPAEGARWRISRRLVTWWFVLALLAGLSRLFMGVHHPSDVIAGWALGLAWLAATLAVWSHVVQGAPEPLDEEAAAGSIEAAP